MLEIPASQPSTQRNSPTSNFTPSKNISGAMEQGTIGPSIVIKGEISGTEPLYIDGRIEGKINFGSSRVTIGRSGQVSANIVARELVVMGSVKGNVECSERLDMRAEGSLTGDVITRLISVEAGAMMKGSIEVRQKQQKELQKEDKAQPPTKPAQVETPKALPAAAGASN